MRGTRNRSGPPRQRVGIIPAYAGNTSVCRTQGDGTWDHPRVCGEHIPDDGSGQTDGGSSPRMRGTHGRRHRQRPDNGIIPAYAGNTRISSPCSNGMRDHPRVCGEHPFSTLAGTGSPGSSPRMRGTPVRVAERHQVSGIIPAYAGNTGRSTAGYPR